MFEVVFTRESVDSLCRDATRNIYYAILKGASPNYFFQNNVIVMLGGEGG